MPLRLTAVLALLFALAPPACSPQEPARGLSAIDGIVAHAMEEKRLPGAVVEIGHGGHVIFDRAYGMRSSTPAPQPMTKDTIFDLASLTKPLVTATAIMQLSQQGKLQLDDPAARYLPAFAAHGKQRITIRELLTHYSGLPSDLPLSAPWSGKQEALHLAYDTVPVASPGSRFLYSDINYIVLGALVEKLSGFSLDRYEAERIARPLGLTHTRFLPPVSWRSLIAPTQYDDRGMLLQGVVDDPTARRMGGVAGNAGLFSTAGDVAIFAQAMLDRLAGRPSDFPLQQSTLKEMIAPSQPSGGKAVRGLGWDIASPFSSPRGKLFPLGSFGHTGYTGTSLWIDPGSDTYVIILSNAIYPRGHRSLAALRSEVADCAAVAVGVGRAEPKVSTGIDVLEAGHFAPLAVLARRHGGRLRLGLLTNQTGRDREGRRTAEILAHDAPAAIPGLQLKLLFSPEHGINGALDTEKIGNSVDAATGLPILSLYGASDSQRRPPLSALRNLDAVVIDLQDVGVRFYTYETLTLYFLEAAAQTGTDIVVLDRPDPIGGAVQGPLSDPGRESYVNAMSIPVRHGMTLGELARYFNGARNLHAPLTVVPMRGWKRMDWYDSTGLTWVNPSPNLTSLAAATLYPAIGLIETTNISVGRGTSRPFQYVGAPWISPRGAMRAAEALNARSLPGVRFSPVSFTPRLPNPYGGQLCHGIQISVTDRNAMKAPEIGLEIAAVLHRFYPAQFELAKMDRLLVNRGVLAALLAGRDPRQIAVGWQGDLRRFETARQPYLLY